MTCSYKQSTIPTPQQMMSQVYILLMDGPDNVTKYPFPKTTVAYLAN